MNNTILVVEDEKSVSDVIKAYLEKDGYKVYCTDKGAEALELLKYKDFKLVILDLMLPDINGEEVCRKIRIMSNVNIFMLTAKGTLNDKIEGLNMGADEYLVKPFSPRELLARVNALFRRLNLYDNSDELKFNNGELIINKAGREVKLYGEKINLTPNEFDILYILAINKGKVLTREQLIEKVFTSDFDGFDRTIDAHIKNLRKKIEKNSKNPKYITTIIKVGYKFVGEVN